eukprot:m51a1_g3235 hypothetical protein (517) ;mRNA; f:115768-118401
MNNPRGSIELNGYTGPGSPRPNRLSRNSSAVDTIIPAFQSNHITDVYEREGDCFTIQIQVSHPSQLFVSYDPSPMHSKALRDDIEDYIVDCFKDIGSSQKAKTVVTLPNEFSGTEEASFIPSAIVNFFRYRELQRKRRLHQIFRQGRSSLIWGALLLVLMLLITVAIGRMGAKFWPDYAWISDTAAQAFVVSGWVALWEPVTLLLHTWRPVRRELKRFRQIRQMEVELEFEAPPRDYDDDDIQPTTSANATRRGQSAQRWTRMLHSISSDIMPAFQSNKITDVYEKDGEYYRIQIKVGHLSQLFADYDPSPVYRKTLRDEIEDYIVDCVDDVGGAKNSMIVVLLPAELVGDEETGAIPSAFVNWFKYRELQKRRQLRDTLRQGEMSLITGIILLLFLLYIAAVITHYAEIYWEEYLWASDLFGQVLTVSGWVAMWEPVTLLLHTWRPIWDDMRSFRRISKIAVVLEFQEQPPAYNDGEPFPATQAVSLPPLLGPLFSFEKHLPSRPSPRPGLANMV